MSSVLVPKYQTEISFIFTSLSSSCLGMHVGEFHKNIVQITLLLVINRD